MEASETNAQNRVARILVVDDDTELCAMLDELLRGAGFEPDFVSSGAKGLTLARSGTYALVVLDVMLPDTDGLRLLEALRGSSDVPVLMLTARGGRSDRVIGLNLGADDYLPKPFDPDEFLARIQAILRRFTRSRCSEQPLRIGRLELIPAMREVRLAGERLNLTAMQFELLALLVANAGCAVSRDDVAKRVYDRPASPFERGIDVNVHHLRQKLKSYGRCIVSIRGVGYQFCPPADGPGDP